MSLAFVMAFSIVGMPASNASAASKKVVKSLSVPGSKTLAEGATATVKATVKTTKKVAKGSLKVTVKSSNAGVVTAKVKKSPAKKGKKGVSTIQLNAISAGTATVTVTTKAASKKGAKLSRKINITVSGGNSGDTTATTAPSATASAEPSATAGATLPAGNADISSSTAPSGETSAEPSETASAEPSAPAESEGPTGVPVIKLKDINVSGDAVIYAGGGQTTLKVSSATEGVDIASVKYASDNTELADVDAETGMVTGKKEGTVIINITATDANGNTVQKTFSIKILAASSAKISLDKTSASLAVNEEMTLKATVTGTTGSEYEAVRWTSSDDTIALVDAFGKVTALSKGSVTITATVGTTGVKDVCEIDVYNSADTAGISSFHATHANVMTVGFTKALSAADQKNLTVTLKFGDKEQVYSQVWAEDGKSVDLKSTANYEAGAYKVTISGKDVALDTEKLTATCEVEEQEVSDIRINTKYIPYSENYDSYDKILFDALDQYGDPMKNIKASEFVWNLQCYDKNGVKKNSVDCSNAVQSTKNVGYILVDPMLDNIVAGDTSNEDSFKVSAYYEANEAVRTTVDVAIKYLAVQSITIDGTEETMIYQHSEKDSNGDLTNHIVELKYTALDSEGQPVDMEAYFDGAYTAKIQATTTDATVCTAPYVTEAGELVVGILPNVSGKATVTVQASDQNTSSYLITVNKTPYAQRINFPEETAINATAGDEELTKIEVSFIDQYGNIMDAGSVEDLSDYFTWSVLKAGDTDIPAGLTNADVAYVSTTNGDYITVDVSDVTESGKAVLRFTSPDGDISNFTLAISAPRAASKIVTQEDGEPKTTLMVGQETTYSFEVQDQKNRAWTDRSTYQIVVTPESSDFITVSDPVVDAQGKGTLTITGKAVTTDMKNLPTIQITLKDAEGTKELTTEPIEFTFTVNPNVDEISVTADDTSYTAGEKIHLTLQAKANGKNLDTYNETIDSMTFTSSVAGEKGYLIEDVTFENGKAEVELEAGKAADEVTYSSSLLSPGNAKAITVTSPTLKVTSGEATGYTISEGSRNSDGKWTYTITLTDSKGNTVDYDKTNGTAVLTIENVSTGKDVTDTYYTFDLQDNKMTVSFEDGVAEIALNKQLATGTRLTFVCNNLTGSYTK